MRFRGRGVIAVLISFVIVMFVGCSADRPQPPTTAVRPVTDTYHGIAIEDNYQWLENAADSEVQQWTQAQSSYARGILEKISARQAIADRLQQLYKEATPSYYRFVSQNGLLFALKEDPTKDQPMLVVMTSPQDLSTVRVVVDPNTIDPSGLTSIDFYVVSADAALVAVSLSKGGREDGDVHVFQVADGRALSDVVPRVNGPTAGGDVAWKADGSGFYYSHYPRTGEKPQDSLRFYQQVYFHRLGAPTESDIYELGREFPVIAEVAFKTSPDNQYVIAQVSNGDGGEFVHYIRMSSGGWQQFTRYEDQISSIKFGPDNSLYLLSHSNAPRGQVLRLPVGQFDLSAATIVVPESDAVIYDFLATDTKIFVSDLVGGPSQIRSFDHEGVFQKLVPILPISTVDGLTCLGGDKVLYRNQNYTTPDAVYLFEPPEESAVKTAIQATSPADFSDVEVVREVAVSKDGTRVPMNIIRRKGTVLNGQNPTILYGYGGYGLSQRPWYERELSLWLDHGGVYVKTNLRGGGEFGEAWHLAGNLTNKQNVFDDFAACAQYLIDQKYTNSSKLAIRGGSNGGLLVGAVMMQHPELFKAVVCEKGVLDALRAQLDPNGAFNTTEYGTVAVPEHFYALRAYSPYANIKAGTRYPDALFTADENDGRVPAYHSKKTVAALQAASPESIILLSVTKGRGHGIGSSLTDDLAYNTKIYSFLFDRLGVEFKTPTK
jgi:prolyl oligopeptidase